MEYENYKDVMNNSVREARNIYDIYDEGARDKIEYCVQRDNFIEAAYGLQKKLGKNNLEELKSIAGRIFDTRAMGLD